MSAAPSRWRLIELKRRREAVRSGIDLLDRKREALVRELAARREGAADRRRDASVALAQARELLRRAFDDIGRPACAAAALAQMSPATLDLREDRVLGVRLAYVDATSGPLQISYGPGGSAASLDRAARFFASLVPTLADLGSQEAAVRTLHHALQRTTRTLNALADVLLPELDAEIRAVAAGL